MDALATFGAVKTFAQKGIIPARSASMVVVILRRNRASLIFSPSILRISCSAGDNGAVFLDIFTSQWLLL